MTSRTATRSIPLVTLLVVAMLAGCAPHGDGRSVHPLDHDRLDQGIDAQLGGLGTCVVVADLRTGADLYRYGHFDVCDRPLPPCATFDMVSDLIGLDRGLVTPSTVFKWDGSPQPVKPWEADTNLVQASKNGVSWWYWRLAAEIGPALYTDRLRAFDYGSKEAGGSGEAFWLGPQSNGRLTISTRGQIDFLKRFYGEGLPVKPLAAAAARSLTEDEIRADAKRGQATMSGRAASCPSQADGSRTVGWFVGRLRTSARDVVFAASVEGADAPPGLEIERRLKGVFADAHLWPAE